jgi:hypothetical protein
VVSARRDPDPVLDDSVHQPMLIRDPLARWVLVPCRSVIFLDAAAVESPSVVGEVAVALRILRQAAHNALIGTPTTKRVAARAGVDRARRGAVQFF